MRVTCSYRIRAPLVVESSAPPRDTSRVVARRFRMESPSRTALASAYPAPGSAIPAESSAALTASRPPSRAISAASLGASLRSHFRNCWPELACRRNASTQNLK